MRIAQIAQFLNLFFENTRRNELGLGIWAWKIKQWKEIGSKKVSFAPFHSRRLKIRGTTPDLIAHSDGFWYISEWQSISSLASRGDS